jgi:hypothetical protein
MLDCWMVTAVFLFLSVLDKWKSGKVTVVILCTAENHDVFVRVSCAAACDLWFDPPHRHEILTFASQRKVSECCDFLSKG